MNLFAYLRARRRVIAFAALALIIFAAVFALYGLPLGAIAYPALLCGALGVAFAVTDIVRARKKHALLASLAEDLETMAQRLPAPEAGEEADYHAVIHALNAELSQRESRMRARFADMLDYYTVWAHQIKTPIAAMRLQVQSDDSPLARRLAPELTRIELYVEMAMTFLRLDSESTDYVIAQCDLDSVVKTAVRRFSGEFIARRLGLNYEPLNTRVVTDEKWLTFVVEQVLSNALKYTRAGSVSIYMEGMKLCIAHTGIGIAPEDLPRIFEKGYTGMNGRSNLRASGLGLYLCRRICENLGHSISAQSTPGRGTTILIDLSQRKLAVD